MTGWNPFCSCPCPKRVGVDEFSLHEERLNSHLGAYDMERVDVSGDGNCLFYALTYGLIYRMKTEHNGFGHSIAERFPLSIDLPPQIFADRLRQICVDQWRSKSDFYSEFVATRQISFKDEVKKFAHNRVYNTVLGDIVPMTIADTLNVHIIIFTSLSHLPRIDVKPTIENPSVSLPSTTIFLAYNQCDRGHYDAAYPRY